MRILVSSLSNPYLPESGKKMAIFDKSERAPLPKASTGNTTTIAAGTSIIGKIDTKSDLQINGEFEGEIHSDGTITVGDTGLIKSTLTAQRLVVCGHFMGTADCDQIEIVSGGVVEGKLISTGLLIDANSSFQGESIRRKQDDATKLLDFADSASRNTVNVDQAEEGIGNKVTS